MTVIRTHHSKDKPYVVLTKATLEIETLSWEAKGLWAYLISRPDNWLIRVSHLMKTFPAGRDKIFKLLRELNKHGLCERTYRREKGRFDKIEYNVFEDITAVAPFTEKPKKKAAPRRQPQPRLPSMESPKDSPCPEKPITVKPTLLSNESTKERKEDKSVSCDTRPPSNSDSKEIASHLLKQILSWKESLSSSSKPDRWYIGIEKLLKSGISKTRVIKVIDWITTSKDHSALFWRPNILSGDKLCKQFDLVEAQMLSQKPSQEQQDIANAFMGVCK